MMSRPDCLGLILESSFSLSAVNLGRAAQCSNPAYPSLGHVEIWAAALQRGKKQGKNYSVFLLLISFEDISVQRLLMNLGLICLIAWSDL